jgi:hypothetical protein
VVTYPISHDAILLSTKHLIFQWIYRNDMVICCEALDQN